MMKVFVRYNDNTNVELHNTYSIAIRRNVVTLLPTSTNDIIKKFVKLYNAQIHGTTLKQHKLDEKNVHLALLDDNNNNDSCATTSNVDYIALPSNLLLTDWFSPNESKNNNNNNNTITSSNHSTTSTIDNNNNTNNNNNNNSNTLFYIRHGKPISQFEFIRHMKDQINTAINDGILNDFVSPTPISIPTQPATTAPAKAAATTTAKTAARAKVATANTCTTTSPSTPTSTKSSKEKDVPFCTGTMLDNRHATISSNSGDNTDQVVTDDNISLEESEFSFPIITLISQTEDNEFEMYCGNQYHQDDKDSTNVDNTIIDFNVIEKEEEEEKQCPVENTNYHDTQHRLDNIIGLPKVTTWIQFDKVQHSFGVDAYVYQEVLEEIRQSKQQHQTQTQTQQQQSTSRNDMLDYYFNDTPTKKKINMEDGILTTQTNIQREKTNTYINDNDDDDNFVVQSRRIIRRTVYYPRSRIEQQQQQSEHPIYNNNNNRYSLTYNKEDTQDTATTTTKLVDVVKDKEPMDRNIEEVHSQDEQQVHEQGPTLDPSEIQSEEAGAQKRKFGSQLSSNSILGKSRSGLGNNMVAWVPKMSRVVRKPKTNSQEEMSLTERTISPEVFEADTSTNSTNNTSTTRTKDILNVKSIQNTTGTKKPFQMFQRVSSTLSTLGSVKKIDNNNNNKRTAIKKNSIGQSHRFGFVMKQVVGRTSAISSSYNMKSKPSSRGTPENESQTQVDKIDEQALAPHITLGLDDRKDEINNYITQEQQTPDKCQQLKQNCNEQQHNELTRSTVEPVTDSNTHVTIKDTDDAKVRSQMLSKKTNHVIQSVSERLSSIVNVKRVDSLDLRKTNHEQECKKNKVGPLRDTLLAMKKWRSNTPVVSANYDLKNDSEAVCESAGTSVQLSVEGQKPQQQPHESIEDVSDKHQQQIDTIQQEDSTHLNPDVGIDTSCAIESSEKTISNTSSTIESMKKIDSLDVNRSITNQGSKDNNIHPLLETVVGMIQTISGVAVGHTTSDTNITSVQLSDSIATSSNIEQQREIENCITTSNNEPVSVAQVDSAREIENCINTSNNEPVSVVQVDSNGTDGGRKQISFAVPSGFENSTESQCKENDDDIKKLEIPSLLFDSRGLKKFKLAFREDNASILAALSMNSNGEDVEARTRVTTGSTLHSDDKNKQIATVDRMETVAEEMSTDSPNNEAEIKIAVPSLEQKYSIDEVHALKEYLKTTGLSIDNDLFDEILSKMEAGNMEKSVEVVLTQYIVGLDETVHSTNVINQTSSKTTTAPRQFFSSLLPKKRVVRVIADVETDPEIEVQSTKTKTIILPYQTQYTSDQVQAVVEYMKSNNIPFDQCLFNDVMRDNALADNVDNDIRSIHAHDHAETEVPVDARDDCC